MCAESRRSTLPRTLPESRSPDASLTRFDSRHGVLSVRRMQRWPCPKTARPSRAPPRAPAPRCRPPTPPDIAELPPAPALDSTVPAEELTAELGSPPIPRPTKRCSRRSPRPRPRRRGGRIPIKEPDLPPEPGQGAHQRRHLGHRRRFVQQSQPGSVLSRLLPGPGTGTLRHLAHPHASLRGDDQRAIAEGRAAGRSRLSRPDRERILQYRHQSRACRRHVAVHEGNGQAVRPAGGLMGGRAARSVPVHRRGRSASARPDITLRLALPCCGCL